MALQSISQFPVIKGIVASNQPLAQPKGSVSRASNLIMTSRGALTPTDGSGVLYSYEGAIQTTRGKFLAETLFDPTGVAPYYLAVIQALDLPLGAPNKLAASAGGSGGTLGTATYYYVVTAIDGDGGETKISNEVNLHVTLGQVVTLTWNVVPNAYAYIIYRGNTPGSEVSILGAGLPVLQPSPISASVTFVDSGFPPGTTLDVTTAVSSAGPIIPNRRITWTTDTTFIPYVGEEFEASGMTPSSFDGFFTVSAVGGPGVFYSTLGSAPAGTTATGGSVLIAGSIPPVSDTTKQTALVQFPNGGTSYTDANIVALFPATVPGLNVPPAGAIGGGSLTPSGTVNSTVNGGIAGMVSLIPQFKQFTNLMIIALGNGFRPQAFSDSTGTPVNPAFVGHVDATDATVDANGVVSLVSTANHGLDMTQAVGANVVVAGITPSVYNGTFVVINIPATNEVQVRNIAAIGAGASSGAGTYTLTTIPLISTFTPAYPEWAASITLGTGDLIVPATQPSPAIYLTVIQGGETAATEPTWPTGGLASIGDRVQEISPGTVIYQVAGLLESAAPAPPGASHIEVFSGALWIFNSWVTNTGSGLDGPTSLRQSSINNPNSWNPVNQAFLDKDDGSEGMGLAKFTITAVGIPPEGSLVAMKNYSPYQIIGVFGAANLTIQAVSSDMGCIAPRTLIFVPGFGVTRYTHLGAAIFNGVKDELISEQIRPYFFPDSNRNFSDIVPVDANWVPISWAALSANPPQYCMAMPVGNSMSELTRIFLYDLVLKGWDIADLPFAISSMAQVRSAVSNPLTIIGGFLDGALQRYQAGDLEWYNDFTAGGFVPIPVTWKFRTLTVASQDTDQRIYCRRLIITGTNSGGSGTITVTPRQSGVPQGTMSFFVPANSDFDIDVAVGLEGKRFDADVTSSLNVELDGCAWESESRPAGVVVAI